jgi:hypothetical protein
MTKAQNNETKDIRTKDGNLKYGHIHDDQVISSMMMQGQESLEFVTIDQNDPRKRWIWTRNRGRYQVISGDDISADQIGVYISSAGGNGQAPGNIEMFSKGTIKIQAENIELIATGSSNDSGNISLQGNQNIRLEGGKEINMDSKESTSISAAADLNLTATNAMKNKAGHIQQETAASALKRPAFPVNGNTDFQHVTGQLFVTRTEAKPEPLGRGSKRIDGSAYIEGPMIVGDAGTFPKISATLMIGPDTNADSPKPNVGGSYCGIPPTKPSLYVVGNSVIKANLFVSSKILSGGDIIASGDVRSQCGGHILSAKKNFDIPHPTKENWRLRHTCPEGPSNDVYIRGRVTNETEIELPEYWTNLVDYSTITVSLTPIGYNQDVNVKEINNNKVFLQTKDGMTINCFYHIFAERKDGEKLIPEYPGTSPADYPGNNDEYSVSGYHYDIKEN